MEQHSGERRRSSSGRSLFVGSARHLGRNSGGYPAIGPGHALLWNGTAASVVDLHPTGFLESLAIGVSGGGQVGYGFATGGNYRALVWRGTAASAVDLHPYLTSLGPNFTASYATGSDDNGTIVGYATAGGLDYAVLWMPIPEPSTGALVCCGMITAALIRHRNVVEIRDAPRLATSAAQQFRPTKSELIQVLSVRKR